MTEVIGDGREERRSAELFETLVGGDVDRFLAGCSESLLLTVWGSATNSTLVSRTQFRAWYDGLRTVTDETLRSEVVFTLSLGIDNVVMLRHRFVLQGRPRQYDTVDHCIFRQGKLAAWFSRPHNVGEYTRAWSDLAPVGADRGRSSSEPARWTSSESLGRALTRSTPWQP